MPVLIVHRNSDRWKFMVVYGEVTGANTREDAGLCGEYDARSSSRAGSFGPHPRQGKGLHDRYCGIQHLGPARSAFSLVTKLTRDIYGLFPRHLFISGPRSYGARHQQMGDRHEHLPLTVIHRQRTRTRNQRTRMSCIFCPMYDAGFGAESFASTSRDPLSHRSNFDRAGKPARSTRGHSAR
jgi:hypothetical protein